MHALPSGMPHWFGPPPPQICGEVQLPHWRMLPHPSLMAPQLAPLVAHVTSPQPELASFAASDPPPRLNPEPSVRVASRVPPSPEAPPTVYPVVVETPLPQAADASPTSVARSKNAR